MLQPSRVHVITACFVACLFLAAHVSRRDWQVSFRVLSSFEDSCDKALHQQADKLIDYYKEDLRGVTHVALIAFPDHPNKGDSAIWVGEKRLLALLNITTVYVVPCCPWPDYNATQMRKAIEPHNQHAAILMHGGGNFGDIYAEQTMREQVIKDFPDYPIRSFPQTLYFKDKERLKHAVEIYGQHKDLQLAARDPKSLQDMQLSFHKHVSVLLPDMATMLVLEGPPIVEMTDNLTLLFQARTDGEGDQNRHEEDIQDEVVELLKKPWSGDNVTIKIEDWLDTDPDMSKAASLDEKAGMRVTAARRFLTRGHVLVTDRMHAHILSLLWQIPHVTIETGSYRKIQRYHNQWLTQCDWPVRQSKLVHNIEDALAMAKQFYSMKH
jgi:exopolysaccharide biosynthesis predicted pyruvyltransferase EpsI